MPSTLAEVAERSGRTLAAVRKDASRGKLRTITSGGQRLVEEEDLETYLTATALQQTADDVSSGGVREVGNLLGRLPSKVAAAVLEAMPTQKKPDGKPELVTKVVKDFPKQLEALVEESPDPHFGHEIGYQHRTSPRWKRTSAHTWSLDSGSWTWNGLFWEGGGSRLGQTLEEGISPAAPAVDRRPLAPPRSGSK